MTNSYFIGVDIGTSGTKAVLTDQTGKIYAEALQEYGVITPRPVWAEQDAHIYEQASFAVIHQVVRESSVDSQKIKGICISGLYGGSGVPLDEKMNPLAPCIIWMDRRAVDICDKLNAQLDTNELLEITGNGIDPYFGYVKMLWIKEHQPELWKKIRLFLPPNQYVIYRLTGEAVIDYTSAGNLGGIYDFSAHCWSQTMLDKLGIPRQLLPSRILEPQEIAGYLRPEQAAELDLPSGIPVCAGCIDCLASTLATGALDDGQNVAIVSTSINWGLIHGAKPSNPEFISMPYCKEPQKMIYTYGGASTAGALLRWYRDLVVPYIEDEYGKAQRASYRQLDELASELPPGSDGLLVLPYFMGERSPIWDSKARGTILGLTLKHTNIHIYRAILEAVAFSLRHIIESSGIEQREGSSCVLIGGASRSTLWRQIFADVLGMPIVYSAQNVEAPLGDAFMAAMAAGSVCDYTEIRNWVEFGQTVRPNWENHRIYSELFSLYKKLYPACKETMHKLAAYQESDTVAE